MIVDWPADSGIDIASQIANMPEWMEYRHGTVLFGVSSVTIESAVADSSFGPPNLPENAKVDWVTYTIARDGTVTCSEGYEPVVRDGKLLFRRVD